LAAIEETSDPRERAETLLDMLITGSPEVDVLEVSRRTLAEVAPVDPDLALVVRARLLLALEATGQPMNDELRAAEQAFAEADVESLGTRLIAGMLARDAAFRGQPRSRVLPLAKRAVGDPDTYAEDLRAGYPHMYALTALALSDELGLAEQRFEAAVEAAERRGSLVGAGIARFMRAHAHVRRGDLAAAERDGRRALAAAERTSEPWLRAIAVAALTEALTERGELRAAQAVLDESGLATVVPETFYLGEVATSRSALHLAAGRPADALGDATAVGRFAEAAGVCHPVLIPWRSLSARALIALGRPAEASVLAHEELAIAEATEVPSAIGAARRLVALATGGDQMIPLLREAVATLETTPARLELARALTDLGAALRRAGHRSDAREPLSRALELAHRLDARLLADTARTELRAAGARPRRAFRTGVDALTPSERRVAELAAAGLTNAEIAAQLFITRKTAEHHLAAVYRKLDIASRRELPAALDTQSAPTAAHARRAVRPQR
jgi:DNA-binding CsgD family transcriptional regulator